MKKLIAKKLLVYAGKRLAAGDAFDATDKDARLLVLLNKAAVAKGKIKEREPVGTTPEGILPVRQYKRRDMKAED